MAEESPLKFVNGKFEMDFDDFERRISIDTHSFILCNPQNPTGNCWSAGGPAADRRDLPEAPRRRPGRRDPLRLGRQGPEVHAVCQPAEQGGRRQQHHLQGRQQVVRPRGAQDRVVLLDQPGPDGARRRATIAPTSTPSAWSPTTRAVTEGEEWLRQANEYVDAHPRLRRQLHRRQDPDDQGAPRRGHLPDVARRHRRRREDQFEEAGRRLQPHQGRRTCRR